MLPHRNAISAIPTLLLALVLGACRSPPTLREFQHAAPFEDMWNRFVSVSESHGFRTDPSATDRGKRVYVSRWRGAAAPFRLSSRERLHGEFTRPENGEGWLLRFYVQKQVVKDISRGFEAEEADWSDAGQHGGREDVILGQLRLAFGQELGIQPSYPQRRR